MFHVYAGLSDAAKWYLKVDLCSHAKHCGCQCHRGLIAQISLQAGEQGWFIAHCSEELIANSLIFDSLMNKDSISYTF